MNSTEEDELLTNDTKVKFPSRAKWITIVWTIMCLIGLLSWLMFFHNTEFNSISLGDVGAFLSGVFSFLAFYWFVEAYLLQSQELRLQRFELKRSIESQQGSEQALKEQSIALKAQLEITTKQFKAFETELNGKKPRFIAINTPEIAIEGSFQGHEEHLKISEKDYLLDSTQDKDILNSLITNSINIVIKLDIENVGLACLLTYFETDLKYRLPEYNSLILTPFKVNMHVKNPLGEIDYYPVTATFSSDIFKNITIEEAFKEAHKVINGLTFTLYYRTKDTSASQKYRLEKDENIHYRFLFVKS